MSTIEYIRDADGTVLGTVCVTAPFTDEEREAMAELMRFARDKAQREDPDNLRADKQRRALDRIHKRITPVCGAKWYPQQLTRCERPDKHDGAHYNGERRWEEQEAVK